MKETRYLIIEGDKAAEDLAIKLAKSKKNEFVMLTKEEMKVIKDPVRFYPFVIEVDESESPKRKGPVRGKGL